MLETNIGPQHPEGLSPVQEELALKLYQIEAVKFGRFKLKLHESNPEAPMSPLYINLRMLRRDVEVKTAAVSVYGEMLSLLEFDLLADVPTAATPLVSSLSDLTGVGMITPRTDNKNYGSGAKVDGMLPTDVGLTAVLIDDLVTGAHSKVEAADVLIANGISVRDVVVLVDREQGGQAELDEKGLRLHSAFTMQQMLDLYARTGTITQEQYRETVDGINNMNAFLASL